MSNNQKTTPAPTPVRFPGIDYTQRPASYWDDPTVLAATLRNVTGENRRRLIRDFHAAGYLDQVDPGLTLDILTESERRSLGRIHPSFLGGEYLPRLKANETEIARIVLLSTTRDVHSIRARQTTTGLLRYSIRDEYEGVYLSPRLPSRGTLTLGQLVDWIDQSRHRDSEDQENGLGLLFTIGNYRPGRNPQPLQDFTSLESQLYPQLGLHYQNLSFQWARRIIAGFLEGETYPDAIASLLQRKVCQNESQALTLLQDYLLLDDQLTTASTTKEEK